MRRWNPRDLGASLRLWLKPESFEGDGTGVLFWRDLSGRGNDYVTASATRPQFGQAPNGKTVAVFNGAAGMFMLPASGNPMQAVASLSTHFVFKNAADPATGWQGAPLGSWGTDLPSDHFPGPDGNFLTKFGSSVRKDYGNPSIQTDVATGVVATLTAPHNGAHRFALNGTSIGSSPVRPYQIAPSPAFGRSMGYSDQPPFYWSGWLGEVVAVGPSVSTTDQRLIEGYLAHEWETSVLSVGHPYRLTPPYRPSRRGGLIL